ncbi:MAG TPA: hypothetical protein VIW68_10815 [Candidatus Sulfotelmatobacter sp.]
MRRKYRPYAALGVGLYLFIMWSAFHWEKTQHLPDGNIFEHREHERLKKLAKDQQAEAEKQAALQRASVRPESRMNAGSAFVAVRYDAAHVVFMVATDSESRFGHASGTPQRITAPAQAAAHLAGLEELWETDSGSSRRLPENLKDTAPGDQWTLSVSANTTVPVTIARSVTAPTGCSLALGFLATVPEKQQASFATSSQEYFVVRRSPVPTAEASQAASLAAPRSAQVSTTSPQVGELAEWKPPANFQKRIEAQLNDRMQQELSRIDATLRANAHSPNPDPDPWLAQNVRARRREWLHRDNRLAANEGRLDYDMRAFRLTPDGSPRLFVRARWKLDGSPIFLMAAWFRADSGTLNQADQAKADQAKVNQDGPKAASQLEPQPALLSADASWSRALREGRPGDSLGDSLDFETILNEFDDDRDGWAELLVYSTDGTSAKFTLNVYTDLGLVPTHTTFQRDLVSPASCADQR